MEKQQYKHLPVEMLRTMVAISETGSLSKAADRLGLSQPGVTNQIKRLQALLGGALFDKTANGSTPTEFGKLVLQHARRILESNDQLLLLGGAQLGPQPLRLGLSTLFVRRFVRNQSAESLDGILINTDHSVAIARGLIDGYIDLACIYANEAIAPELSDLVLKRADEPLVWVRSPNFSLRPGMPIPILTWPNDDFMIRALERKNISYKIVFNGPDFYAKLDAVAAGIGLTAIPDSAVPDDLVRAHESYLPELNPIRALLCARAGFDEKTGGAVLNQLSSIFFDGPATG
jgi:DNA-binding transcriptional LysR family regulator